MTRIRRAMVRTDSGLLICAFEVDPPLEHGEVEIVVEEIAIGRVATPRMDPVKLKALADRTLRP